MNHSGSSTLILRWLFILSVNALSPLFAAEPEKFTLWPDIRPQESERESNGATITLIRPDNPNGTAIVICPGGGYRNLVTGPEGTGIARWLASHGITGIVLEYRLPHGDPNRPLSDAQRAIRVARSKARDWNCDPSRIGIIGFSAGGHLASTAATHFDEGDSAAPDPIERVSSRPDFALLVYPVISMGKFAHAGSRANFLGERPSPSLVKLYSNELQVSPATPPIFLTHALDDTVVTSENSKLFYQALLKHNVPARYLELPSGGHGLNGYKGPMWDRWQKQSMLWLAEQGFLPRSGSGL